MCSMSYYSLILTILENIQFASPLEKLLSMNFLLWNLIIQLNNLIVSHPDHKANSELFRSGSKCSSKHELHMITLWMLGKITTLWFWGPPIAASKGSVVVLRGLYCSCIVGPACCELVTWLLFQTMSHLVLLHGITLLKRNLIDFTWKRSRRPTESWPVAAVRKPPFVLWIWLKYSPCFTQGLKNKTKSRLF